MTDQAETTQVAIQAPRNELRLSGPRLPYHPLIEERFGIDRGSWKFLTDVLYPNAEEPETIINVLAYCKARNLDVMKKPVHVVPVWDKKRKRMVDSVWPAIAEIRITAMRTGEYVGKGKTIYGPKITETLGGVEITYPEYAQLTVYRLVAGVAREFNGEELLWKEFYAKAGRDTAAPNDMWKTKPFKQLAKCAEADALRAAFPEEAGSDSTAEEMAGQEVDHVYSAADPAIGSGLRARLEQQSERPTEGFNAKALETLGEPDTEAEHDEDGVVIEPEAEVEDVKPQPPKARDEINGPAPSGVIYMLAGDPVSDAGRVPTYRDGEKHSTCAAKGAADLARYTMHPTSGPQDSAPSVEGGAETQASSPSQKPSGSSTIPNTAALGGGAISASHSDDDEFPGDRPAPSTAQAAREAASSGPEPGPDDEDASEWQPLERHTGRAPRGVEYTLSDDLIDADDTAQAYENGEPSRRVELRDFVNLPEYDAHPDMAEAIDAEFIDEKTATIFDEMAQDTSWLTLKARLPKINNDPDFLELDPEEQSIIRRRIWSIVVALKEKHRDPVDFADDPSAFRLWVDTQEGVEGANAIDGTLRVLRGSSAFKKMPEAAQAKLVDIAEGIAKKLRG